jgi:hypothetical protein
MMSAPKRNAPGFHLGRFNGSPSAPPTEGVRQGASGSWRIQRKAPKGRFGAFDLACMPHMQFTGLCAIVLWMGKPIGSVLMALSPYEHLYEPYGTMAFSEAFCPSAEITVNVCGSSTPQLCQSRTYSSPSTRVVVFIVVPSS